MLALSSIFSKGFLAFHLSYTYVERMDDPGLAKARQAAGGRNADLARLLGITPAAISQWVRVPYRRALQIEARTAGRVTREELRPDLFGAPLARETSA
jgi:DNA-binding transcriptional regulator YdaS (Cro superfamily)